MLNGDHHARKPLLVGTAALLAILLSAAATAAADAYLGITMSNLTPSMSRALKIEEGIGVLVDRVVVGSPAERAGLLSGDVIFAIDDHTIQGNRDLSRIVRESAPGDELRLTIQREGKQRRIKVTLGERPQRKVDGRGGLFEDVDIRRWLDGDWKDYEASIKENVARLTKGYLGVALDESHAPEGKQKGALVSRVFAGSPAEEADIRAGDLIVASDGKAVEGHKDLLQRLEQTKPGETIVLRILRDGETRESTVELAGFAERFGIADLIRRFQSGDSSTVMIRPPTPPRPPLPPRHRAPSQKLDEERADLEELRQDLEELREQLRKLRRELDQRR